MTRAIDCLVNVDFADRPMPDWMVRVEGGLLQGWRLVLLESRPRPAPRRHGCPRRREGHLVDAGVGRPRAAALSFVEARPDRFALAVGGFDLLRPMPTVRALQAFVANHPVACAVVGPSFWGDGMYPPTDAVYFPLYTKCCELDLPLCLNTGIPGPPLPAEPQNPIHIDRVCYRFPELRLSMIHGADPWWDVAIRLMIKYRNLRLMTSAWSPKRLPESLLHFMRTRGKDRVMFASDYPVLSMERCIGEARALDLPDDVRDAWLYDNANEFFFGAR